MATTPSKLTFHLERAHSPAKIQVLLKVLKYRDEPVHTDDDLEQLALEQSAYTTRFTEARSLAEQLLGLIQHTKEHGFQLTSRANAILEKREPIQYDLLHYLLFTTWRSEEPSKHVRSWLYRAFTENLWGKNDLKLDLKVRRQLTQELYNQASEYFLSVPGFSEEHFSIGIKTLDGLEEWLQCLKPAVLEEGKFARRGACSGELFLLALSRSYEMSGSEAGMDLLLTPQRRDEISRLCLLEPLQFDRMLDWTLPMFPQFLTPGTLAGSYGRFVRLQRFVTLEDYA